MLLLLLHIKTGGSSRWHWLSGFAPSRSWLLIRTSLTDCVLFMSIFVRILFFIHSFIHSFIHCLFPSFYTLPSFSCLIGDLKGNCTVCGGRLPAAAKSSSDGWCNRHCFILANQITSLVSQHAYDCVCIWARNGLQRYFRQSLDHQSAN
jgi:hypothetical protein